MARRDGARGCMWLWVIVCLAMGGLLLVRLQASVSPIPAGYALSDGGLGVRSVEFGSPAWRLGIRAGDRHVGWHDVTGGQFQTVVGDVGLAADLPARPWWPLLAVLALLVVAILLRPWAPRVGQALVVAASSLLALDLIGVATGPAAPLVVVMPTLIAGTLLASMAWRARALVGLAAIVAIAMALEVGLLGTATPATWSLVWVSSAAVPTVIAAMIVTGSAVSVVRAAAHGRRQGVPASAALIHQTVPGRAALREQRERWLDARVTWIHETILPRLSLGLHDVDMGNVAAGSGILHVLARDLREDLEHDQLSVLRVGGLRGALDGALDAARSAGFECSLDIDEVGAPAPWAAVAAAWRVAQEAIENARRHSSADHVWVTVRSRRDRLVVRVVDDGVGVDPQTPRHAGHLGLTLMRDQARDVGADLRLVDRRPTGLEVAFDWRRR